MDAERMTPPVGIGAASPAFTMRTTKPGAGNKYYMRKTSGGYSDAVKGSPTDAQCDVLANCVGYAVGRFNEIGGWGACKYLSPVNAENFIQFAGGLEVGQTPRLGACMVWQKGATLSGSDGAGHVCIVEKVISSTEVFTSESGWNSTPFWNQNRKKGNGNWGQSSAYKFLGFIYNPAACCKADEITAAQEKTAQDFVKEWQTWLDVEADGAPGVKTLTAAIARLLSGLLDLHALRKGDKGDAVMVAQGFLYTLGYDPKCLDGNYGPGMVAAVAKFQADNGLDDDGKAGKDTITALLGALQ